MISLNKLKKSRGSTTKSFQKGRGIGSGNGKTCGKGHKGQRSRSGHMKVGFEGGQNPLFRRIPKFGLKSVVKKKNYVAINVDFLNIFDDGTVIDVSLLKSKRVIRKKDKDIKIKILGNGDLTKKLNVKAHKFSLLAKKKIKEAGGSIEIINS